MCFDDVLELMINGDLDIPKLAINQNMNKYITNHNLRSAKQYCLIAVAIHEQERQQMFKRSHFGS